MRRVVVYFGLPAVVLLSLLAIGGAALLAPPDERQRFDSPDAAVDVLMLKNRPSSN